MLERMVKEAEILLGVPGEIIFKEGLKKYLISKVEENLHAISNLQKKYGVTEYLELETQIRKGDIPGHPAWEDVILWEELSRHTEALQNLISRLEAGEPFAS